MKKIPINKQYFTIACYVVAVVVVCVLFEKAAGNISLIGGWIGGVLGGILKVLAPFVYGCVIAYTINSGVKSIERNIMARIPKIRERPKIKRVLSVVLCYIIFIGAITWFIIYLIPEITRNITNMATNITKWFNDQNLYVNGSVIDEWVDWVNDNFSTNIVKADLMNSVLKPVMDFVAGLPNYATTVISGAIKAASVALNFVLGMVIAFYMLCEKETYSEFAKKLCFLTMRRERANRVIHAAGAANKTFEQFIIGKAIDSFIIGVIFFVICVILGVRYALLLALIIGVTNMIPYFGPFIGAAPTILIVMTYDLPMSLWMILIIFVLQQFDGIFLGPKILGDSLGLKPMGVIFAIFVGGWIAGVPGMFFGVPLFAVFWTMITTLVNRRYAETEGAADEVTRREPPIIEEYEDDYGGFDEEPSPIDAAEDFDHSFDYAIRHRKAKAKPKGETEETGKKN